ncbi:MAG: sodium:proton antiporter NhaD [Pseudomonadota bacterium]
MTKIGAFRSRLQGIIFASLMFLLSRPAYAAEGAAPDYTGHWAGYVCLALVVLAYLLVVSEEVIHIRKSKPVIVAAGIVWVLVAYIYHQNGRGGEVSELLRQNFLEYAEVAFFLLSAMTYINTLEERNVFQALRVKMVSMGLSFKTIYWITGLMAFFMSPVADNLTTALVFGAVVLAVGAGNPVFVSVSFISIVVAANAGGAFCPFGDITTLMVWQKGIVTFFEFFALFIPSLVSWLVPAVLMSFAISNETSPKVSGDSAVVKRGGYVVIALFMLTVALTVVLYHTLSLPPFLGMMTGLGLLMLYGHFIRKYETDRKVEKPFDIFTSIRRVEWDTLLFFYGIILCIGGLGTIGYLTGLSRFLYQDMGATTAGILIGLVSAVIDNIPVMFAVLRMAPDISHGQWLLVTLTVGIGGSILSIGSAAGVALMGQARGVYTFFSHLKWSWAVALGYAAGIWAHILLNNVH